MKSACGTAFRNGRRIFAGAAGGYPEAGGVDAAKRSADDRGGLIDEQ